MGNCAALTYKMIDIYFYNFSKKENSTATPSGGTTFRGTVKTPSSIQAPVVELSLDSFPAFNYCYIPSFSRFYYVTGTTYSRGLWEISLRCDVLASFKAEIGGTPMYIERSSAVQNGNIIDNMYPATDYYTENNTVIEYGNLIAWAAGRIVVSIINGTSASGMVAYQFTPGEFSRFLAGLMSTDTDSSTSVWDSVTQSIKVTTYEPLRYIGACYWFPDDFTVGSEVTTLKLGNYTASGFSCYPLYTASSPKHITYSVTIPKHPQAATRGSFCNLSPFSEYSLNLASFGNIKLDSTALVGASTINIDILPDPFTGMARAVITTNTGALLANLATQWGVPLRISSFGQYSVANGLQVAGGLIGTVAGVAGGSVESILGGIGSTIKGVEGMAKGSFSTVGSTGAIIDHQTNKTLYARFFTIANDDNTNNGRPYCAVNTPAALGGYMSAQKGVVASSTASKVELDAINSYMEEGFYYE